MTMSDETKKRFINFAKKHEVGIIFTLGAITGITAGLSMKVTITYKNELEKVGKLLLKSNIPQKTVKTYIVRAKDNPEEVFKIIKF